MADTSLKQVVFHLRRYEPGKDREPHWEHVQDRRHCPA